MTDYESKLTWFLVLLVLFLAVVNFQTVELSKRTQSALRLEFERRALAVAAFADEKLRGFDLAAAIERHRGLSYVSEPQYLRDAEVRLGLASITVLDRDGFPLLGSMARERPTEPELLGLDPDAITRLMATGEPVLSQSYAEPYGVRTLRSVYRPIYDRRGVPAGILAVAFQIHPLAMLDRLSSWLLAYQLMGFAVVAMLLLVFVRWFMRPYRALMSTARAAGIGDDASGGQDETTFVVKTFRDTIARLRDREEELRRLHLREKVRADEQARLASHITGSMASGVVVFARDARLDFLNRAAEEILRVSAHELAGAGPGAVFRHAPQLGRLLEDSLRTGESHPRCEIALEPPDGEPRALGASTFPILQDDGAVAGALALLTDLTDIKALQERMKVRESLASLGEMSAGIAHEFRNSLATILGFSNLLERKGESRPEIVEDVRAIRLEAEGLNRIVSEFLRFSRPLTPQLQPIDLKGLVAECARDLRSQPEFQGVVFDQQEMLPVSLFGDDLLLRQAVGNLLRNAAEAALARPDPRVVVRGFRDVAGSAIQIAITDNGAGIPTRDRSRVFLPFFTTKEAGTGLGLALTQKIVLAHDGEIRLDSKEGEGATFTVVLPVREAAP